jgi:hypothetical protein
MAGVLNVALGEAAALRDVVLAQLVEQKRAQVRRHVVLDLHADHLAEPPLENLLLDRGEQVLRLLDGNVEIGVPRDPERIPGRHLESRKERAQVRADDLLQRYEVEGTPLHRHPARETARHLHAREAYGAPFWVAHLGGDRQRQIGDVRERMTGIDGERRENGKDLRLEVLVDGPPLDRRQIIDCEESHAVRRQLHEELLEASALQLHQPRDLGVDRIELILRRTAVVRPLHHARRDLTAESRDANHVELVEVRREDRQELDALEQRRPRVQCLMKDAGVEGKPTQLPIEIELGSIHDFRHTEESGRFRSAGSQAPLATPSTS